MIANYLYRTHFQICGETITEKPCSCCGCLPKRVDRFKYTQPFQVVEVRAMIGTGKECYFQRAVACSKECAEACLAHISKGATERQRTK